MPIDRLSRCIFALGTMLLQSPLFQRLDNNFCRRRSCLVFEPHDLSYESSRFRYRTFSFGTATLHAFGTVIHFGHTIRSHLALPPHNPSIGGLIAVCELAAVHWTRQQVRQGYHEE
jgi:hypothetical protein